MIVILFQAGTFGSTIEYCLSNFSNELTKVPFGLTDTGSMHGFEKELHIFSANGLDQLKRKSLNLVTALYPLIDGQNAKESVETWKKNIDPSQKVIFTYCSTMEQLERNQLFLYYKLPSELWLDVLIKEDKVRCWNDNYRCWKDMKLYELRELLSFFIDQLDSYLGVNELVPNNWYKITPDNILLNFDNEIESMIQFCNLTQNHDSISDFGQLWVSKQQYILNEFERINKITESIKKDQYAEWTKLSLVAEAIIQSRLRRSGIELACHGLETFPTNTNILKRHFI